jgi:hypothetical protein
VVVLVVDRRLKRRRLGIVAMAAVACVKASSLALVWQGTSLDAEAPMLKGPVARAVRVDPLRERGRRQGRGGRVKRLLVRTLK